MDGTTTDPPDLAVVPGQDRNEPKPEAHNRGKTLTVRFSASTATDPVTKIQAQDDGGGQRFPATRQSSSSSFTAWESTDFGTKPYGWLKTGYQTASVELPPNGPVQNANKTKAVVDFESFVDNSNKCSHLSTDGRYSVGRFVFNLFWILSGGSLRLKNYRTSWIQLVLPVGNFPAPHEIFIITGGKQEIFSILPFSLLEFC